MSDFYASLKQSIIDRGISEPAAREAIYAQARSGMIRQLWAREPKLGEDNIDARMEAFDRAVESIENDLVAAFAALGGGESESDAEPVLATVSQDVSADEEEEEEEDAGDRGADLEALPATPGWDAAAPEDDENDVYAPETGRAADNGHPFMPLPPRAEPSRSRRRYANSAAPDEDPYAFDEEAEMPRFDRWRDEEATNLSDVETRLPPPRRRLGLTLSETDKVRVLIGAIGVLAVLLIGAIVYVLLPSRDGGVTLPLNVRREVSDAATAARIANQTLDVRQSYVVFDGRDPTIFRATPNNPVRLESDDQGSYARISTSIESAGVKVVVGPGLASQLADKDIRVTITARGSRERGAASMRFAYQSGLAISHWQTANLETAFAPVALVWHVPMLQPSTAGGDYIVVEPGIPGDGTAADISSIKIDVLNAAPGT